MVILERPVAATTCLIRSSFILRLCELSLHVLHLQIGTLFLTEPIGPARAMAAGSSVSEEGMNCTPVPVDSVADRRSQSQPFQHAFCDSEYSDVQYLWLVRYSPRAILSNWPRIAPNCSLITFRAQGCFR